MTPAEVRDMFESALRAKRETDHIIHRIEALSSPVLSAGIASAVHSGKSDPTAKAGSMLADERDASRKIIAQYQEMTAEVQSIINGTRIGMGVIYGDILEDRYIRGLGYDAVALLNGVSRTTVIRYRDIAFDGIASVGPSKAKTGDFGIVASIA